MDLRALRYFIAVLEAGSLSRAAHSLYVAQPALTAQIKKLKASWVRNCWSAATPA